MRQDRRQFELLEKKVARLEDEVKALKEAQAPAAAPKPVAEVAKISKDAEVMRDLERDLYRAAAPKKAAKPPAKSKPVETYPGYAVGRAASKKKED